MGRLPRGASPVGRHPSAWVASGPLGGRTGGTVGGRARRLALRQLPASIHRAFGPAVPPPRSGPRPEPLLLPPRVPHRRRQGDMGASARGGSEPVPSPGPGGREGQVGRSGRSRLPGHRTRPEDPMIRRGHGEGTIYRGRTAAGRRRSGRTADGAPLDRPHPGRGPTRSGLPARFGPDPKAFKPTAADRATNATWRLAPRNVCDIMSWGWQTCAEVGMAVYWPAAGTSGPW